MSDEVTVRPLNAWILFPGALVAALFSWRPLWPTDLWDHVNYGKWILFHGRIPQQEPLLEFAADTPMVDFAWLAQVGLAVVFREVGVAGLQWVYGVLTAASLVVIAIAVLRITGSPVFGILSMSVFLAINWFQFLVIRPQVVGIVFFSLLIALLATRGLVRKQWLFLLPPMFMVWANCHGSFALGLIVLTIAAGSRVFDVLIGERSVRALWRDVGARRLLLLVFLCTAASAINPYGPSVLVAVLRVSQHPNIRDMFEWNALSLANQQGRIFAAAALLLAIAVALSPRRVRTDEFFIIVLTGGMTLTSVRMINWAAPVLAVSLTVHAAALCNRLGIVPIIPVERQLPAVSRPSCRALFVAACSGLALLLTPLGMQIMAGRHPSIAESVTSRTPVSAAGFLQSMDSVPNGTAFCSAEWSGYLICFGPAEFHPLVNLHVHLIPEHVWNDYMRIIAGNDEWQTLFDRYDIRLAVTDLARHGRLIGHLRRSHDWQMLFEDDQTVIFRSL